LIGFASAAVAASDEMNAKISAMPMNHPASFAKSFRWGSGELWPKHSWP
jgi:hypothetical protein